MTQPQATIICPACGSRNTSEFLVGNRHPQLQLTRPFVYFLCRGCRLRFQVVSVREAKGLFADVQDTATRVRPLKRREVHCEAEVLNRLKKTGARRLLDVGAGDGNFLAVARELGFDCMGTDVSVRLAEAARRRSGAPVLVGDLEELGLSPESFDVVNLDAVLMYVATPCELMIQIARLLRPGGICRIHEYNPDSVIGRLKGKRYWMYTPTHVNVWPAKSIRSVAATAGLVVERTIAGTEASLSSWMNARQSAGIWSKMREIRLFLLRRARIGSVTLGADVVYYLRKPTNAKHAPGRPAENLKTLATVGEGTWCA
jgi:SAM-dependent methyltransferase